MVGRDATLEGEARFTSAAGSFGRVDSAGRRLKQAGEIQAAYRRQRRFPSALRAESADAGILVRQEHGVHASGTHCLGQNRRAIISLWHG